VIPPIRLFYPTDPHDYPTDPHERDPQDVLLVVRNHLSRHRECEEPDAYDLAQVLGLPEMEIQCALEALRDDEGGLLP
jgi:hypothetical protein